MSSQRVSVEDWPRLTRFYGIPPSELARMPNALLRVYAEQLLVLHAEETLLSFTVADLPYSKEGDRRRVHRSFERLLPRAEAESVDVRSDSGAAVAASMGIGLHLGEGSQEPEVESGEEA